jgi:DNA cross-link repair 1A protein
MDLDKDGLVTSDIHSTPIRTLPMASVTPSRIGDLLEAERDSYRRVVMVRPSGWSHKSSYRGFKNVISVLAPYSEHSSFHELRDFVQFISPQRIFPIVQTDNLHQIWPHS